MRITACSIFLLTVVASGLTESQFDSHDVSFWAENLAQLGRYSDDHSKWITSRYLKKGNNGKEKGGKDNNNKNKKDNKKEKKQKEKHNRKCKKNKNCNPTPAPTVIPPTLNLTGMTCGLFCDGKGTKCDSADDCCDDIEFVACDASEFGEAGVYHCGRVSEYLGKCIEHDVVAHTVNAPPCTEFCAGIQTSCEGAINCCPYGYTLCNDAHLLHSPPQHGSGGFNSAWYRCGQVDTYTANGICLPASTTTYPTAIPTYRYPPTFRPSRRPSARPSCAPTEEPTLEPTLRPTKKQTTSPSVAPSLVREENGEGSTETTAPSIVGESDQRWAAPSRRPSSRPSAVPTFEMEEGNENDEVEAENRDDTTLMPTIGK